jgi:hypothetical protein
VAFVFFAFVFLAFVVVVVSCPPVGCANTGIVMENATANANNSVKSFFMLGLDLLGNYFLFSWEQGMGHWLEITRGVANQLKSDGL